MIKEKQVKIWKGSSDANNDPYTWGCDPQSESHRC